MILYSIQSVMNIKTSKTGFIEGRAYVAWTSDELNDLEYPITIAYGSSEEEAKEKLLINITTNKNDKEKTNN